MLLRYCSSCNLPYPPRYSTAAKKQGCARCGAALVFVDSYSLLIALGRQLDGEQREKALVEATDLKVMP